jgi:hypothetical protein
MRLHSFRYPLKSEVMEIMFRTIPLNTNGSCKSRRNKWLEQVLSTTTQYQRVDNDRATHALELQTLHIRMYIRYDNMALHSHTTL